MRRVTATEAARRFSEMLDAVEEGGETIVVVRHGRPVAQLAPAVAAAGARVKALVREHRPDRRWHEDLRALRARLRVQERRWTG